MINSIDLRVNQFLLRLDKVLVVNRSQKIYNSVRLFFFTLEMIQELVNAFYGIEFRCPGTESVTALADSLVEETW